MSEDGAKNNSLSPLQKFILRNWELLDHDELAGFLGIEPEIFADIAKSAGLPEVEVIPFDRALPLIMRRNHDLLPEPEIARLMGMDLEELREICLEMDFLDIKLGPRPQSYPKLIADGQDANVELAQLVEFCFEFFSDYDSWEKPFAFLDEFNSPEQAVQINQGELYPPLRMMYSYTASHGDFLLTGEEFYTDGVLQRLANRGVNAGLMPVLLRDIAPGGAFSEFGSGHEKRIESIRREVEHAAEYGISIYLYLNEPRFTDEAFFERHPSAKGTRAHTDGQFGMCTSDEEVRTWLHDSAKFVFENVPKLGGVVLITASENQTNCFSRASGTAHIDDPSFCRKCGERGPEVVLGDTASILAEAAYYSGTGARVIQWLWGWDKISEDSIELAVGILPKNVEIMVDWAKNTRFSVGGAEALIGEYTLAHVKPSDYSRRIIRAAKKNGRKVHSKCALVTTCEMGALPYFPVMKNVDMLLENLIEEKIDGLLGCWIFGAYPGRNMEMLAYTEYASPMSVLASKYYGSGEDMAIKAWELFSEAIIHYPSTPPVLYYSAIYPGPGLRFSLEPEPWRMGMALMATEDIDAASDPFGPDAMIGGFRAMAELWKDGLDYLQRAVEMCDIHEWREENIRDLNMSRACLSHFITAANYADFILLRNTWLADRSDERIYQNLIGILQNELQNAETMFEIVKTDSRMGYEGSIGYFYTPTDIAEKIYDLKASIGRLSGGS